jgi:hypothetical protein
MTAAANRSLKILCPNGHLGFATSRPESFALGLREAPDLIACDSGSGDCGPGPLGADVCASPRAWQEHDIEMMLRGARARGVPMIIGSCGDTGTNSRVDRFREIVRTIVERDRLGPLKVGWFYSEVPHALVRERLGAVRGLDGRPDLTEAELDATDRIVAVAGVHPFIRLLEAGADVILAGRSSDCAIFAAPAIRDGYPEALAYYYGKVMECASFCAEPYGAKESVLGEISMEDVRVTAMAPDQRCTIASVAGHAMYERSNPYYEYFLGGHIDMRDCVYEQLTERTTRVTGPRYVPAPELRVKLEGAGKVGERFVGLVGVRDPYTVSRIDDVIAWARARTRERFGDEGYSLSYTVYGRDGVMGKLEPLRDRPAHELCVVVQGVAPTRALAEEVTVSGSRQMFYARLPEVRGTAGGVAFLLDEVMPGSAAYRWTMNHTMPVTDPMELFPVHMEEVGA